MLQQYLQSRHVPLDAGEVKGCIEISRESHSDVCTVLKQQSYDLRVLFLCSQQEWRQARQRKLVNLGVLIQKFLDNIKVLRLSPDGVHERSAFLLIFVLDEGVVV